MKFTLRVAMLAAAAFALSGQSADRTEVAFHAAMKKETVDGDLKGAIEAYKKLAQGRDPAIAAKALVRMGECYEKLGDSEARKSYERVLREFAGQKEAVAMASARLAALGKDSGGGGIRVVSRSASGGIGSPPCKSTSSPDCTHGPSPDGRYLLQNGANGAMELRNLATEQVQVLTRRGPARTAAFSPDGRQVAYAFGGDNEQRGLSGNSSQELWIVGTDGARDHKVWTHQKNGGMGVAGWFPDGTRVLVYTWERPYRLIAVSIADGTAVTMREGDWFRDPQLSPDGRFVLHWVQSENKAEQDEIRLFALADQSDSTVLQDLTTARDPQWTPDGNGILFLSDRRQPDRIWDLWLLRLSGGKPLGSPQIVKTDLASGDSTENPAPLALNGLTRDGAYYYYQRRTLLFREILTSALDPATGRAVGPLERLHSQGGQSYGSSLSRDGRQLVYLRSPSADQAQTVVLRSLETGEERVIPTLQSGKLFPDGRSLLVNTVAPKDAAGFYRVDITTGSKTLLKHGEYGAWFHLSSDGKTIYFSRRDPKSPLAHLVRWNIETGEENDLLTAQGNGMEGAIIFHLSPNGSQLAVSVQEGKNGLAKLMPAEGGESRTILQDTKPFFVEGWWPDGRYILVGAGPNFAEDLERIPVAGGERQSLGLSSLTGPFVYADGRRIGFVSRTNKSGIWSVEKFLPKASR